MLTETKLLRIIVHCGSAADAFGMPFRAQKQRLSSSAPPFPARSCLYAHLDSGQHCIETTIIAECAMPVDLEGQHETYSAVTR
jgi:hypothetical protein